MRSHELIAHILSLDVDFVRDFRIGDRPSSEQYIRIADFAVVRRSCIPGEKEEDLPGYFGRYAGAGTAEDAMVCGGPNVSAEARGTDGRLLEVEPALGLRECVLDVMVLGTFIAVGVSL